ncbi:hypothetical protein HanXRQr2_Chr13g0605721 [Helianthus annuus]|uniref:Uncharacterized protein n=1 Tax=Helianthus annuus TaxID=4232 RepID=A0A9K3EKW6_HELAN|nr:hypothetical protein HanXRQr2_Chr13g0605721 [Helianthus annuus]KAJ0850701.1 hypothetical protein HanPSC8_Chr13g0583901 [Helianthus annuus]
MASTTTEFRVPTTILLERRQQCQFKRRPTLRRSSGTSLSLWWILGRYWIIGGGCRNKAGDGRYTCEGNSDTKKLGIRMQEMEMKKTTFVIYV